MNIRFIHDLPLEQIPLLGAARLNILRDPALVPVGDYLKKRFGMPYLPSFPSGISSTTAFLETVAGTCGVECRNAVADEQALQEATLAEFADLSGSTVSFENIHVDQDCIRTVRTVARVLKVKIKNNGCRVPLPTTPPVGVAGVRRMLHRWRCTIHA